MQPFLAAALAVVAVPFLLHLFTRRKFNQVPFTALFFLKQTRRRSMRRLTLHHLLVLLCRAAAVGLLALAFMMPTTKAGRVTIPGGKSRAALAVVLDDSYSMDWRGGGASAFERARAGAAALVRQAARDDEVIFMTVCGGTSSTLSSRTLTPEALAAKIEQAQISDCPGSVVASVNRAVYEIEKTPVPDRRVVVMTDMQANAFAGAPRPPEAQAPDISFVDFGAADAARTNTGFSDVNIPNFPQAGESVPLCFSIKGGADGARPVVALTIDGVPRGEQAVKLNAGKSGAASAKGCFRVTFPAEGRHYGSLSLQGDSLSRDNIRYFTADVTGKISVLLLADRKSLADPASDAFYIDAALRAAASARGKSAPLIESRAESPENFNEQELKGVRVVIIPGGSAPTREALVKLRDFAATGGGVLIINDGRSVPGELISGLFFGGDVVIGAALAGGLNFENVSSFDPAHEIFKGMSGASKEVSSTKFYSPARVTVNSDAVRVLMKLSSGQPVFIENRLGAGRAAYLACGVNPFQSNVALKTYFLPMIVRAVTFLGKDRPSGRRDFILGEQVTIEAPEGVRDGVLSASPANGRGEPVRLGRVPAAGGASYVAQSEAGAGVYTVRAAGRTADAFAVNLDQSEGDLSRVKASDVKTKFAMYSVRISGSSRADDAERLAAWSYNKGFNYLWIPCALGAFLFMGLDTALSNRR